MGDSSASKKFSGAKGLLAAVVVIVALLVQEFTGLNLLQLGGPSQDAGTAASESRDANASVSRTGKKGVDFVYEQFKAHKSSVWVTTEGKVKLLLADDTKAPRHQQFLLELDAARDFTVKVAHNIDDAPYIPLKRDDTIQIQGRYEYNNLGGVIHFTHRADNPSKRKPGGWIDHKGQRYQ
ncbi:MAG: DUF3465 domain-containing protein [Planctomycetes bacterium]|nr:DUF3465 domain-containing protein [Planctomycetota bacterium]